MLTATVIQAFRREEQEYKPGDQFECSRWEFNKWAALGFVQAYETKVKVAPKKPEPSSASQAAPASRKSKSSKRTKKPTD